MLKLKEKSISWSIEHINKFNDTYIFPLPFEFEAINGQKKKVIDYIRNLDISSCGVRPYRAEIIPKSALGFRIATQLDPLDSIIYNAILYEIATQIEEKRVKKDRNIVFSYRLNPQKDGTLYDKDYNWESFNKRTIHIIEEKNYRYVVTTDIADFFSSIYLHNVETCLRESVKPSGKSSHAEVIIKMIKAMHTSQTHKGLPIGPQFSRPIAELILTEIDELLLSNDIEFVRYVDDYRIFTNTQSEAYTSLSFLSQKLFDLRNLKLNESKTSILEIDDFKKRHIHKYEEQKRVIALDDFYELCERLGIDVNSYDPIDLDNFSDEDIEELNALNIVDLLKSEILKTEPNLGSIKFLLNNLAKIENTEAVDIILDKNNIPKIFPILHSCINYIERVQSFSEKQKHTIGSNVINLIENSYISELQFNRMWLLYLFTKSQEWNNIEVIESLVKKYTDDMTKRKLLLCMGRAQSIFYYRENRLLNIENMNPWVKRAFIAGISCLPKDERKAWYYSRSFHKRDELDMILEDWYANNHF